ncbi:amino acid permease-domain-containing protein [Podospora didyma]|uniref:Amino acid permease-domain-containing protein n=1 Tax=Podospora didyma TaxID=330526 RepID=A0AAE0KJQ9_9PEZI|nr:amino acid permease-domain-containing protein [Podospora didyma]
MDQEIATKRHKLGVASGVYIPVCLNIVSILMFLRFGQILGQVGLLGIFGLMLIAYTVDFVTTLSLSAIASNGEVKGGGAYYLISRSLGPEFGGSIGLLFYLAQVLNTALNVVGLIDCIKLNMGVSMPQGYWWEYLFATVALLACTALCLAGSSIFSKASNALLVVLTISIASIPLSALVLPSFEDPTRGIEFTGVSLATLRSNLWPHTTGREFDGLETFRGLFGILFPATSGIFAGASMSGDLRNPSKDIPVGTLWAMLSTFIAYVLVILSLASSTAHYSFLQNANIIQDTNIWPPMIFAGEIATTFFSALMGIIGSAKLMQALARDKLFPGFSIFGRGTKRADEPVLAILLTYVFAQLSMFANLNQIATLISMGYQMTFFVMNLACFLLKIGSAPNFRPGFKFFTWQTAFTGSILSASAMFFIDETYATTAVCLLVFLFLMIHYLSPPKHWGDVSQNLIYHQVRKYLLRLKPEHIKFWRPQIILLINNPRRQTRLIQFCNSMKKGALYILGHVIVTDDFSAGVAEAKLQQAAWTKYISEYSRIKAFVQLTMSPSITWGVRNLILSAGLGGMRPNIAIMGFFNMDDFRGSHPAMNIPEPPFSPTAAQQANTPAEGKGQRRRRGDTSARLLEGFLPTDAMKTEEMMTVTEYLTILEDLALKYRLNVAIGKGFEALETPRKDGNNIKKYIDLWPIQMSAELSADGKSVLTTNFDTCTQFSNTLILQLGYILRTVPAWKKVYRLRVLVFVEYENEVDEERGRVRALLEKLRIEAEVLVFWLASGNISTYEVIIHGNGGNSETERLVDECLKDQEWWEDLRHFRGSHSMTGSEEFASISQVIESASGRASQYTPHSASMGAADGRRPSWAQFSELPKKSTVSQLAKMGLNMGFHTQNLPVDVFDGAATEVGGGSDSDSGSSSTDFNDAASEADMDEVEPMRLPLLPSVRRRRSYGDALGRPKGPWRERRPKVADRRTSRSYGATTQNNQDYDQAANLTKGGTGNNSPHASLASIKPEEVPQIARQGSSTTRFSSPLVPQTMVSNLDGSGPRIMFSEATARPGFSRQSSVGRFSSLLVPETRVSTDEGSNGRTVSFAEPGPGTRTPIRSRKNSLSKLSPSGGGDVLLDIPEILSSYRFHQREDGENGSSYSTQGLSLSFNNLPSRAQHLILNELMRQNSDDTAVLFTTLPPPEENTCLSEDASLTYLSDIEVLCDGLPPVLLVLSNNMTVTVSL